MRHDANAAPGGIGAETVRFQELTTIPELLARRAEELGDRVALIGNDGTANYQSLTFAQVDALSRAVGCWLHAELAKGADNDTRPRRIAWAAGNSNGLAAMVLHYATCLIGATSVPVNPASTPQEIVDIVERTGAGVLLGPAAAIAAVVDIGAANPRCLVVDGLDDLRVISPEGDIVSHPLGDDSAVILFTSGTTGRSKGVVHSHRTSLAAGAGWRRAFELGVDDVYQSPFPIYAGAGLHFSGLACLIAGATYIVDEARPTAASLSRIAQHGATIYAAVPSIYHYWLEQDCAAYDLSSLRMLDFGGSVMHKATIEALRDLLPGVDLVQSYGLTEAGPAGLYLPPQSLDSKLGSIGSAGTGGMRFRVDAPLGDSDDGHRRAATSRGEGGTVGELQFAGPSLMLEYLDDPENTAAVFDGEWLRTGDLVRMDDDGYVYFLERLKDLIIRGGFNISSVEIEEAILQYPGIAQAAAFGVAHPTLGEVVGLAVVPTAPGLDVSALRTHARRVLARVKVPAWILVTDELPLSPAGKILKSRLRDHADLVNWED